MAISGFSWRQKKAKSPLPPTQNWKLAKIPKNKAMKKKARSSDQRQLNEAVKK